MGLLFVTYPVSLLTATLIFFTGLILSTFFMNIFFILFIVFLLYTDCLTIVPLLHYTENFINFIFEKQIPIVTKNIQQTFPVESKGPVQQGIYLFHPHGLFSIAQAFHVGSSMTDWPVKNIKGSVHFFISLCPILKDIVKYNGKFISANYDEMKKVLTDGNSLSVSLGGLNESKYTDVSKMVLHIKHRTGIFKMSLETGIPLVPVISYNENKIYKRIENPLIYYLDSIIGYKVNFPTISSVIEWFSILKKPLSYTIPTYIGEPLEVGEAHIPTEEEIIELREKYFVALKKLYLETRPEIYTEDLEIV